MMNKICCICGKEVEPEDLIVKITENKKIVDVVFVHQGKCDNTLVERCSYEGKSANASFNLNFFKTDEEIEQYKNSNFNLSDTEFIERCMDQNGHLKSDAEL